MILTDISGKIKRIADISSKIFIFLSILLTLSGVFLSISILGREQEREGSLRVISVNLATSPQPPAVEGGDVTVKGNYVASRSGSFYYLPSCSGAKRIKEKNRVWFQTKDDAEARGLKPSATCDGL